MLYPAEPILLFPAPKNPPSSVHNTEKNNESGDDDCCYKLYREKTQITIIVFKLSCHLRFYVILVILVIIEVITRNHSHQSYHGINAQSCY